jgi:hypothetical protein
MRTAVKAAIFSSLACLWKRFHASLALAAGSRIGVLRLYAAPTAG